jgi:uncharacterized membrane protein YphA (DoxX/SURF4 family)
MDQLQEPRWALFLFASTTAGWLWLVVRLYVASVFLPAGWGKITGGDWLLGDGSPIQGLVTGALTSKDTPGWYVWFLENVVQPNAGLFATLVALWEFAVTSNAGRTADRDAAFGVFHANVTARGAPAGGPDHLGTLRRWRGGCGMDRFDRWFLPWVQRHERDHDPTT